MPDEIPIVPHELVDGTDCCGCLVPVFHEDQADIVCNECSALIMTVPASNVAGALTDILYSQRAFSGAECPQCGALNLFPGMSEVKAFVCSECGKGIGLP